MSIHFTFHQAAPTSNQRMEVILGGLTAKAFVAVPHQYKAIGIVRFGIEFGMLAVTLEGHYVRVNGTQIERLSSREVEDAIYRAKHLGRGESFRTSRAAELEAPPAPAPAVFLKRHRRVDPELAANNSQLQPLAA